VFGKATKAPTRRAKKLRPRSTRAAFANDYPADIVHLAKSNAQVVLGLAAPTDEVVRSGHGAAADEQTEPGLVLQQPDQATAKNAVAADDQDFPADGHARKRSACDGSAT
jgi:hypothetical protein